MTPHVNVIRILANAYFGLDPVTAGIRNRLPAECALTVCRQNGWLGLACKITPLGVEALRRYASKVNLDVNALPPLPGETDLPGLAPPDSGND